LLDEATNPNLATLLLTVAVGVVVVVPTVVRIRERAGRIALKAR
jgi:hypothetical protein